MKTVTNTTMLVALLLLASLLISGCAPVSTPMPLAKKETKLKHSFGADHITQAITNAAKDNGWKIARSASNANGLLLKKTFSKKETAKDARGRMWNKVNISEEILANVAVSENSYVVEIAPESSKFFSNFHAQEELKRELHKLENSISIELIHEIL